MKRLWAERAIDAPAEVVWPLLVDTDCWPEWGPTVRRVEVDSRCVSLGSRGRIKTAVGLWLPFEITQFDEGRAWSWRVGGVPATDHTVEAIDELSCRVAFGVPWVAAPYLGACTVALRRVDALAGRDRS